MASLELETWPVPGPADGRREARRYLDELHARGAIDEGTPEAIDRLVDSWERHWVSWAAAERLRTIAAAEQRLAATQRELGFARSVLADAWGQVMYARQMLINANLRPHAHVTQASPTNPEDDDAGPDSSTASDGATVDPRWPAPPEDGGDDDEPGSHRLRTWITWGALLVLAGGDAFGFAQTLVGIIKRDTSLLYFLVAALTLSAVLVAYQIGRYARRIADGVAGNAMPWLVTMSVAWCVLGLIAFWIRAHPAQSVVAAPATDSVFGPDPTAASSGASWSSTWGTALLLLCLYVSTGIVTITDAYRRESPRRESQRSATRFHQETLVYYASALQNVRGLEQQEKLDEAAVSAAEADHTAEDSCRDECAGIKAEARVHLARLLGNASSTAAVLRVPPETLDAARTAGPDPDDPTPVDRTEPDDELWSA